MVFHDFSYRGKLASSFGVIVETQAEYIRPQRRVTGVTLPGRPGDLSQDEGPEAYEPVQLSPVCYLAPGTDPWTVGAWLDGAGTLILGSMPDYAYQARVANQIPFTRLFQGAGGYFCFTPIFICQPLRYEASPGADKVFTAAGTLTNPGTICARPRITLEGSGDIELVAGGAAVSLTNITGGIIIDSELEDCLTLDGATLINDRLASDFPVIQPGSNWPVSWTGTVTKVTIKPRWRWL